MSCSKMLDALNYVNPFSEGFKKDFNATKDWNFFARWATRIACLILAIPFVLPGVLVFRWTVSIVNRCSKKKVENPIEENKDNEIEENKDNEIEENKDNEIKENKDNEIKENKDNEIEENKDNEIEENKEPKIEENKDTKIEENKDTKILKSVRRTRETEEKKSWGSLWGSVVSTFKNEESKNREDVEWKTRRYEGFVNQWIKQIEVCNPVEDIEKTRIKNPMFQILKVLEECAKGFQLKCRFDKEKIIEHRESVKKTIQYCIQIIREAYKKNNNVVEFKKNLNHLSYMLFHCDLSKEMTYTLTVFNNINEVPQYEDCIIGDDELFGKKTFPSGLIDLHNKIEGVPSNFKTPVFSKLKNQINGNFGIDFDPILEGNLPQELYKIKVGDKQINVLALPTPTSEQKQLNKWGDSTYVINPEFKGALTHLADNNKKHLYVLNQDILAEKGLYGNERPRCKLILDLQEKEDLKDSFFCIALSKNSNFYLEGGSKKEKNAFKEELRKHIMNHDNGKGTGCFIPDEIQNKFGNFEQFLNNLIDNVVNSYTDKTLSVEHRKAIIEQVYDLLTLAIADKVEADELSIACKDTADRGGAANAQLYGHVSLIENGKFLASVKNKIAELLFVRALFAKKRSIEKARMERLVTVFINSQERVKGLLDACKFALNDKKVEIVKVLPVN